MIEIGTVNRTAPALSRSTCVEQSFNRVRPAYARNTVKSINLGKGPAPDKPASQPIAKPAAAIQPPKLTRPALKGQKVALGIPQGQATRLRVAFGWNVNDPRCEIDASAFLLADNSRVPGDEWFVFYGQPDSPDGSVGLRPDDGADRQSITVDLGRLNPAIQRVVFVMTINEALENHLNFGMISEAWLRVLDEAGRELVGYRPTELYENVTSMTLGELYLRKGEWRFNPVGNGVRTDLAGQCAVYGVEIS